jgi:hypothetical protein
LKKLGVKNLKLDAKKLTKFSIGWGKLNEIIFIENKVENKGN